MLKTTIGANGEIILPSEILSLADMQCGDDLIAYVPTRGEIKLIRVSRVSEPVIHAAIELFEEEELAFEWLSSPLAIFSGKSPLLHSLKNLQDVLDLIERIKRGEFN